MAALLDTNVSDPVCLPFLLKPSLQALHAKEQGHLVWIAGRGITQKRLFADCGYDQGKGALCDGACQVIEKNGPQRKIIQDSELALFLSDFVAVQHDAIMAPMAELEFLNLGNDCADVVSLMENAKRPEQRRGFPG